MPNMSDSHATDRISTCSSLAKRALAGAQEIESILVDKVDEAGASELQKLRSLATKLQQLSKAAAELQAGLHAASVTSAGLKTALSTQLPESDTTAAIVVKQLMRLGKNTPREAISVATILQYESFAESTMRFLFFMTQLLSIDSAQGQQANLEVRDAKLLLAAVACACRDIERSGGILFDTETVSHNTSSEADMSDTRPPAYPAHEDAPPSFEEPSDSVYAKPGFAEAEAGGEGSSSNRIKNNRESSGGFLSSLANPFRAATAALRPKPEPLVVPLCQAAMIDNVAQMRSLLNEGANINGRNENGQTALICAILADKLDAVQLLLKAGADHRLCDAGRKGKPPLFHAISAENRVAAELLLKHGAAANQSDEWGGQAYFVNLITGETAPELIALLLSHGADASAKDMSGRPLVMLAMRKRQKVEDREEVVRLLLRHGAKADSKDYDGTQLICLCVQQKRAGLVHELLAMGVDPNARDTSGISLLSTAIKQNDLHLAKALLERRADPNTPDIYGSAPILTVLRDSKLPAADRVALAEMLLEHGARGDKKDPWGVTALEYSLTPIVEDITAAASLGGKELKIQEQLLKQGANPNQRLTKVSGEPTLLAYAFDRELWDLAAMALRHGANANLADKKGRTPLAQAMQKGNVDAVALLIRHGVNVNQPQQVLPLDLAMAVPKPEIIELLKAHGAVSAGGQQ